MSHLSREDVVEALKKVVDFAQNRDVVSLGWISGITIKDNQTGFILTLPAEDAKHKAWLRDACEAAVQAIPGVESVTAVLTADTPPTSDTLSPAPAAPPPQTSATPRKPAQWNHSPVSYVKHIVAIASGKGGVGKSTTTVNLAHALHATGKHVGILDADIYGPSIPHMMQLHDAGKPATAGNRMIPVQNHGIACMSMGLLMQDQAAVLRGPMITKALVQMLRNVTWGTQGNHLDILLIDMPPGTGDIHISLVQQAPLDGAIIVTTPQQVAVNDAAKCIDMFDKVNIPILGIIENMSSKEGTPVFGEGGGTMLAQRCPAPLLAQIPLDSTLCRQMDAGDTLDISNETGLRYKEAAQMLGSIIGTSVPA